MKIDNGAGSGGYQLEITSDKQAKVLAETHSEARFHSEKGEVFLVHSGFVVSSAVADTFASIIYIKNTSTTKDIHIGHLRTCNEVAAKWRMKVAATSISNSTATTANNMNSSSTITLDATIEYGAANSTTTGGDEMSTWIQPGPGHSEPNLSGALILGPSSTLVLEMAPFASVAGEVCINIECWQPTE